MKVPDGLPEFSHTAPEAMRPVLEDGVVALGRSRGTLSVPAEFMLVGTTDPCAARQWLTIDGPSPER